MPSYNRSGKKQPSRRLREPSPREVQAATRDLRRIRAAARCPRLFRASVALIRALLVVASLTGAGLAAELADDIYKTTSLYECHAHGCDSPGAP